MITAIGIDIVDVARVERLIDRYGARFITRVLGKQEVAVLGSRRDKAQFVAGRFAAKEALIKAFGEYLKDRPGFSQIEILSDGGGGPQVFCRFAMIEPLASARKMVSISHEKSYAVAMAILSEES